MKILYHINSPETVYAARFIYEGYRFAFKDKGHEFKTFTSNDDLVEILDKFTPDIFISSLHRYNLKFLDLELLKAYREQEGLVFFNQLSPWKKMSKQYAGGGLENDGYLVKLIKDGLAGDIFFHWLEQDSPFMEGFTEETCYPYHTILLAADKNRFYYDYDEKYKADISYVGSYLPRKKKIIKERVFPLMGKYNVQLYGSDWTFKDRALGYVQKFGQYFNIDVLKNVRGLKLPLDDERKVYSSSAISLNIHEDHQRKYNSDFNERTFKIIASGGFEICDNVEVLRKYFTENELVIAEGKKDWFDKINYYIEHPEERQKIIDAGRKKVLKRHTYHNRVDQIINMYRDLKDGK